MKHMPFYGWEMLDQRVLGAIKAGHPEWGDLPATAKQARERGDTLFFTGKPCKNGHLCPKRDDSRCVYCTRRISRSWQDRNPELVKRYAVETWERVKADPTRHCRDKAGQREHQKRNPGYYAERTRRRNMTIQQATPRWLTAEQVADMVAIYDTAARLTRETGILHEVDHIIPLSRPDVCGLHVPWNLQVLVKQDNLRKSNRFDGTMGNEGWRLANRPSKALAA